jgi:hypothetical protein
MEIAVIRKGYTIAPWDDDDRKRLLAFPERIPISARLTGPLNPGSLRELRGYFGSCKYVADLALNESMNSKFKVDHLTRLKLNFVKGTVFDERGLLHWLVKSLSFDNCHQPDRHAFISQAFEEHAHLAGVYDVELYLKNLREMPK